MTLRILVLGSAAGGGFPQWNGNDETSRRARAGDPKLPLRTQSSLALSADGRRWVLLNASPDLREQINARRQLHPLAEAAKRSSPIAAVVLTNADVDHVAGLLSLRENQPFALYAHRRVLDVLAENSIFKVINPAVSRGAACRSTTRRNCATPPARRSICGSWHSRCRERRRSGARTKLSRLLERAPAIRSVWRSARRLDRCAVLHSGLRRDDG